MKWDLSNLPIEAKTALLSPTEVGRVGEHGVVSEATPLAIQKQLPDGKVLLRRSDKAIVLLLVRNTGKALLRFSVAPHSTHPGMATLGFAFDCLCNGHIYEVPAGSVWYRIMRLSTRSVPSGKSVVLAHRIFEVKGKAKN